MRRCLSSLAAQEVGAKEIVVGRRSNDDGSASVIAEYSRTTDGRIREAVVGENKNLVASMNAALKQTTSEFVALTDDDAEAKPDWLKRLLQAFTDESVGGVGGRDLQIEFASAAPVTQVGQIRWFGKLIGNHHLGTGPPRDVDVLKGVNCCFRGELIRSVGIDTTLLGTGNVSNWEISLCSAIKRQGYRLTYDPSIIVDHNPGPRLDGDLNHRRGFEPESYKAAIFNETRGIMAHPSYRKKIAYSLWTTLIGSRYAPGFARVLVDSFTMGPSKTMRRYSACLAGRLNYLRSRGRRSVNANSIDAPPLISSKQISYEEKVTRE